MIHMKYKHYHAIIIFKNNLTIELMKFLFLQCNFDLPGYIEYLRTSSEHTG